MTAFSAFNPISIIIYYACVVTLGLFNLNPVTALISFCGALLFRGMLYRKKAVKEHIFAIIMFLTVTLINPIFSHNGKTVLFMMNDNPVTAEALLYGAVMAVMLVSSYYWLKTFSQIMTSDKLLYAFGKASPKTALILSMSLRMLPLLSKQAAKTENAQKAMGQYSDSDIYTRIKGKVKVLSILITWAIENAIVTADSMASRGYSGERRTSYSIFKFRLKDFLLSAGCVLLSLPVISAIATGTAYFEFYPTISFPEPRGVILFSYISFAFLSIIPTLFEAGDKLKWKFYLLKT